LSDDQVDTVLYIALALLFVSCIGFVTAAYARAVRQHRREQAIRGLLDVAAAASADRGSSFGSLDESVNDNPAIVGR